MRIYVMVMILMMLLFSCGEEGRTIEKIVYIEAPDSSTIIDVDNEEISDVNELIDVDVLVDSENISNDVETIDNEELSDEELIDDEVSDDELIDNDELSDGELSDGDLSDGDLFDNYGHDGQECFPNDTCRYDHLDCIHYGNSTICNSIYEYSGSDMYGDRYTDKRNKLEWAVNPTSKMFTYGRNYMRCNEMVGTWRVPKLTDWRTIINTKYQNPATMFPPLVELSKIPGFIMSYWVYNVDVMPGTALNYINVINGDGLDGELVVENQEELHQIICVRNVY